MNCAYVTRTVHVRFTPFKRRFSQRLLHLYLDVDRIADAAKALRLFAYNRPGVFSFYDKDHGDRTGAPLRVWAERMFREAGVELGGGRIGLLTFPRVLGYVFNPISLFIGHDCEGRARGVIYEVNNTFGETHAYVAPLQDGPVNAHAARKNLHVSPFFDVAGQYRFRLKPPEQDFHLAVENEVEGRIAHSATLGGARAALTDGRLLRTLVTYPFMTLQVIAAIHWHALFLWLRGAGYRAKPHAPVEPATIGDPDGANSLPGSLKAG